MGTGFPTVGLRWWYGPGCGWSWVLFSPARRGWGLGWVCLGSVCGVVPLLPAVCGVRGWALVSARFRDLCGFVRVSLAPPPFPVSPCGVGVRAGPGSRLCPALLGWVVGVCFLCFFFRLLGVPVPGLVVSPPVSFLFGWAAGFFFFGCLLVSVPLFPVGRCSWLGVAGFRWVVPLCLFGGPVFGALLVFLAGDLLAAGSFRTAPLSPPPFFFFGVGGAAWLFLPLPSLGWRLLCGWCVVWLVPRHSWRRFLCATPRHSWLGFAAGGGGRSPPLLAGVRWRWWCVVCGVWRWCVGGVVAGVWFGWSLATPGGGSCVLLPATPGWVSLPLVVGGPRHSWLGSVGGVAVWCVVCGVGVLVGLWLVCGVVGPSPLLAEVPVCYSPPLLAGFRCRWSWAVPATPGWGPLAAVVCGVWCVVCGVWRWCVGGVVAGVWCGWSLATPGGGSFVLLPATPGWVSLPLVVGGPRPSWLGSVGGGGVWCVVCGVVCCWGCGWCVACGGGVLLGLWLVCGVVGPSPLLAVVPVCYSPPLLAGFRCRLWAVPATPGWGPLAVVVCCVCCVLCWWGPSPLLAEVPVCYSPPLLAGFRCRWWWAVPATPGWGPLAAVVCGVWCVVCRGGVLFGLWLVCGVVGPSPLLAEVPVCYSPPLLAGFRCRWWWAVPATPGWGPLAVVVCGVWCVLCWWGPSPLLAEVPVCYSPPLLAGFRCRWWWAVPATPGWGPLAAVVCGVWCVVCGGGVLLGLWLVCGVVGPSPLLADVPVCYSPPLLAGFRCRWWWAVPATPGWGPLAAVVCGVWCVVCGVWRWCVGGVVAGVWCGWSLATPGGGSFVLLPATPGWVSLPLVVGGPRHSWLGSVGGGGVWCVVCGVVCCWGCGWCVACGGGVLLGLWLVCGVVGPSPLLAVVPVCYSPPLLAGFRCRWWWAVPATPGWGPLAVVVCGVWCVLCWWGPSPLLAEVPVCYSPPLLAGFRCRWWWAVPATPGWGPLAAVVCGVWCVVCGGGVL